MYEVDDMPIGVNALLFNKDNKLLLGRRKGIFGDGLFSLIGGKMKQGETIEECIIRELKEEVGIHVEPKAVKVVNMATTRIRIPMIQIGVEIREYKGVPTIIEPMYCSELSFFDLHNLPEMFPVTKTNVDLYLQKQFYSPYINI